MLTTAMISRSAFLADRTATQYDWLLASFCLSVCL